MNNKRTKRGARAAVLSGLAVIIFLALNIGLANLPQSLFEIDITGNSLYTVSEQSGQFLSELDSDIELIIVARNDSIDERLLKLLYNYAALSPRVSIREADPSINPAVLDTYDVQEGTVVVRCAGTGESEAVAVAGFHGYGEGLILYDYTSYAQSGTMRPVALDAEGQLMAAINRVTGASGPRVYITEGHGESALGTSITTQLSKLNITPEPVNLLKAGLVPDDCELLICILPTADLADDELTMLSLYLRNGGKLLLVTESPGLANFDALLALYGLQLEQGYVADIERYYENYFSYYGYNCIYPELSASSDVTRELTADALLILPRGMTQVTPGRSGSTVTPFMQTSELGGVNYVDENTAVEGRYILGAVAAESIAGRGQSRLTVITAASLISDEIISAVPGAANLDVFVNAATSNLGGAAASIPQKSLSIAYNTPRSAGLTSAFFIGFLPLAFIVCGLSVWLTRRKR